VLVKVVVIRLRRTGDGAQKKNEANDQAF